MGREKACHAHGGEVLAVLIKQDINVTPPPITSFIDLL